ncbi:MAG TPA: hypothetical protein VK809_11995 [Bacteroidia bacterium]|jgi:hypothetical protein|nr:hypothetical protein [Bacteroidia bacterium]
MKIFLRTTAATLFITSFLLWFAVRYFSDSIRINPGVISLKIVYSFMRFFQLFIGIGWPWAISVNLYKVLPTDLKGMRIQIFKTVLSIYLLALIIEHTLFTMNNAHSLFHPLSYLLLYAAIILVLHIYFAQFIAKELTSIELQRATTWGDYSGTFFLLLFGPIGIWWIQPKINKLFTEETEDDAS